MKKFLYAITLSVPVFALWFCTSSTTAKNQNKDESFQSKVIQPGEKGIAVLELFTSQGCSSCPPADKLLGTYISKTNVIALSFHVDYWDRSGWKDPYSSHRYSQRQYKYASELKSDVYTPQLIINGQAEMIGSDAHKISSTLNKIFSEQPGATLKVTKAEPGNGKINIIFDAEGNTANSLLSIAVVERKTITQVNAGENGGAKLIGYNVVRNFSTINNIVNGKDTTSIDISPSSDLKNMSVVLFLQQKGNNKITAADKSDL